MSERHAGGDHQDECPIGRMAPNLRLKLSGLLLKESAVASPGVLPMQGRAPCASGHVARSLSAIR